LGFPFLAIATFRRRFIAERESIRKRVQRIVEVYAPRIRDALQQQEDGFCRWESENAGPQRCGSESASREEVEGRDRAMELSTEMLTKICAIRNYDWHFHPICNPAEMVENPYPGFLSTERGRSYCDHLVKAFG
jgi:hypothetical protein